MVLTIAPSEPKEFFLIVQGSHARIQIPQPKVISVIFRFIRRRKTDQLDENLGTRIDGKLGTNGAPRIGNVVAGTGDAGMLVRQIALGF